MLFNNNKPDVENANEVKQPPPPPTKPVVTETKKNEDVNQAEYDILKQNVGKIKTLIYRVNIC